MPFLSIIIPVYNKSQYLNKCVQSIVAQSFTDWEIILVDDGSTDSSPNICDQWSARDSRIQVFHQKNAGVSTARNNGLKKATGEYIQFTDADDWWGENMLQQLHDELLACASPDVLVFGMTKVYPDGREEEHRPQSKANINKKRFLSNLIAEQKQTGVYGGVWNKWTSRNLIEKHSICFNASYNLIEDYDFFLSVYEHCQRLVLSGLCKYYYLQEAENSSTSRGFRFHYPHVMAIRMKAYNLVEKVCGDIKVNQDILQEELENLYLGMYVELPEPTYETIKKLHAEVISLLEGKFTLKPYGTSFNTKIISFFLRKQLFRILSFYLKLRKHISHA